MAIRLAMLYGSECWYEKQHIGKITVTCMRMLRSISGKTIKYRIRNEDVSDNQGVAPIKDK